MSGVAASPCTLRLVNADSAPVLPARHTPARTVPLARHDSSALDAADARWVLAVRTTMAIEGGQAAILRPEARRKLVAEATRMGLRPFDAALVIAIAQDAARTGEALSGGVQGRLALVRPAGQSENAMKPGVLLFTSSCLAAMIFLTIKAWLLP